MTPADLSCPQCADEGRPASKIGNYRAACTLCNRYAQRVQRKVSAALQELMADDAARLRSQIEQDLYPDAVREYRPVLTGNRSTVRSAR